MKLSIDKGQIRLTHLFGGTSSTMQYITLKSKEVPYAFGEVLLTIIVLTIVMTSEYV